MPIPTAEAPKPPYQPHYGNDIIAQAPGTILFGSVNGPIKEGWLDAYVAFPEDGVPYSFRLAFGAFWGQPLGVTHIRITLYRVTRSGTLRLVWTDQKAIDRDATGYFDYLAKFTAVGTYRLEVTRGSRLLAWGVIPLGPPCGPTNCSGG